jgi:hypothetical protein
VTPARTIAPTDLCPHTGRSRLSYERAEYLFKQRTRTVEPPGTGYTLRQLHISADAAASEVGQA